MKAPGFWQTNGLLPALLSPISAIWTLGGRMRRAMVTPYSPSIPVLCVGNAVAGGAGKTPVVLACVTALRRMGRSPSVLSRGYGGTERGPLLVDAEAHTAAAVGDEQMLLSRAAPTIIAQDRVSGARMLETMGVDVIVMDDGLQNPSIHPTFSILVVDGGAGFGNGHVMPAGPLREPLQDAFGRCAAAVVLGADRFDLTSRLKAGLGHGAPIFSAHLEPEAGAEALRGQRVLAFAGIGRPDKFGETLTDLGVELADLKAYPDHHPYRPDEIMRLVEQANAEGAALMTTEKDFVRLPEEAKSMVQILPVSLAWQDPTDFEDWLRQSLDA